MSKFVYTYAGRKYSWGELILMLIDLHNADERKQKWWRRIKLDPWSYSHGVSVGMLYGTKIIRNVLTQQTEYSLDDAEEKKQ